jgi:hypothetical protein
MICLGFMARYRYSKQQSQDRDKQLNGIDGTGLVTKLLDLMAMMGERMSEMDRGQRRCLFHYRCCSISISLLDDGYNSNAIPHRHVAISRCSEHPVTLC